MGAGIGRGLDCGILGLFLVGVELNVSKFLAFGMLFWLFGNPIVAIIVLLLILYVLDRRFVGLSPSLFKPLKRRNRIGKLKQQLGTNPHDVSAKMELARLLIERRAYREARQWLEPIIRLNSGMISEPAGCTPASRNGEKPRSGRRWS